MLSLDHIIKHSRNREYMTGVERDQLRIKNTSEVFTPTDLVQYMIQNYIDLSVIKDNFLDPSCGDGQILSEVLITKMECGMTFEQSLDTVYGVDIMIDNVDLCRQRLLCGSTDPRHIAIVEKNIQCRDALTFEFNFKPITTHRKKQEDLLRQRFLKKRIKRQLELEKENLIKENEIILKTFISYKKN